MKTGFKSSTSGELHIKLTCLMFFALVIAFSRSGAAIAAPSLSDGEAKAIIESHWNSSFELAPIGQFTVVSEGKSDIAKGVLPQGNYVLLKAWEKAGVVSIAADQQYENDKHGKGFSLDQGYQQTQQGVVAKIAVSPTEAGRQYLEHTTGSRLPYLKVPVGSFVVTKVVKNEERKKGVDDYRLVMLTYTAEFNSVYKKYKDALGRPESTSKKGVVLLKWDALDSKWKRVAMDLANSNEEFATSNVANVIGQ